MVNDALYRMNFKYSIYRGVYGSGDNGCDEKYFSEEFKAISDEEAKSIANKEVANRNRNSSNSYSLTSLLRIDQEEKSTQIVLEDRTLKIV